MPVTWNTVDIDGREWLVWEGQLRIPKDWDPNSGVMVAVTPPGGLANLPALVKGDNGFAPLLQSDAEVTELEHDDPTPVTSEWVLVTPGTETTAPVYKEVRTQRKGIPGADGTLTIATADDLSGTASARKIIVRNDANNGFEYQTQKVGNLFWPASITSAAAATTATLCPVSLPAQDFDWRPVVFGTAIVTSTTGATDVRVDLLARLNGETTGNIVGRGFGLAGATDRLRLEAGPPAGSSDSYNKVLAGNTATVHLRLERQAGSDTFAASNTTASFMVQVVPIP